MKKIAFNNSRRGAVMPLVALVMIFVLLGFSALVVDAGVIYGERRNMVTAADAAALAGAKVMYEAFGTDDYESAETIEEAINDAKELAVKNGVKDQNDIVVIIGDDPEFNRDTIRVKVINNEKLIFANIFGDSNTDVVAESVASWGYVTSFEGGDIIPVFTKDTDYQTEEVTYLHNGKFIGNDGDIVNGNWGLIDIYQSTNMIGRAFRGDFIGDSMEIDSIIDNHTGNNVGNISNYIRDRMIAANDLPDRDDRIRYMSGLVPVITWNDIEKQGSSLKLPISTFAVFEIYDVIVDAGNNNNKLSKGAPEALYDSDDYFSDGNAKVYEPVGGVDLEKATIIGKFTGETIQLGVIVDPDDQSNPSPGTQTATYYKLFK